MKLPKRQQGFTLIELMFASVLGFLLILPVFGLLFQSVDIAASLETKAKLNTQARETLDMLGDGVSHGGGVDVFGLRGSDVGFFSADHIGRNADIGPDSYLNDQFVLEGGLLETAKISPINITCLGVGDPFPVCTGAGEITVNGYLYDDPGLYSITRSIGERTRELEIEIIDYVGVARDNTSLQNNREIYRTIYMFNRD